MADPVKLVLLVFGGKGSPLMAWPRFDYNVEAKVAEIFSSCNSWCEGTAYSSLRSGLTRAKT